MQHGEFRSYRGSRLVKFVLWIFVNFKDTYETGESFFFILIFFTPTVCEIQVREREDATNSDISPVPVSNLVDDGSGQLDKSKPTKSKNQIKKETTIERGNPLNSEIPEWLQEFRENLVDDEIPL